MQGASKSYLVRDPEENVLVTQSGFLMHRQLGER